MEKTRPRSVRFTRKFEGEGASGRRDVMLEDYPAWRRKIWDGFLA
ncbi:MAG: hypothetical protein QW238_05005 [Candidatus Bathyarchaeia archaeon]